jgi:hypothetical protein
MNDQLHREYRRQRNARGGRPMGAATCLAIARSIVGATATDAIDLDGEWFHHEPTGAEVRVRVEPDEYGEDDLEPLTYAEAFEYARAVGASKGTADQWARADVAEFNDQRSDLEWWAIVVDARIGNLPAGHAALGGIDIGARTTWNEMRATFADYAHELIGEAVHHVIDQASKVCV